MYPSQAHGFFTWLTCEILVLIALSSNDCSGESAHIHQSRHCSHTKSMGIDEGSEKFLASIAKLNTSAW